jgi:hypothetical protein
VTDIAFALTPHGATATQINIEELQSLPKSQYYLSRSPLLKAALGRRQKCFIRVIEF